MSASTIEWTERTWNPVVGCTKISPGCKNCYAEVMSRRLRAIGVPGYEDPFTVVKTLPKRLKDPTHRKKATMFFVNSMSDLFHPDVEQSFVHDVFDTIERCPQHVFQILTKRPKLIEPVMGARKIPSNAWIGTSVENKRHGVPRIGELSRVSSTMRFLSIEPLLEDIGTIDLTGISWVIVGGESGHKARPMDIAWVRSLRDQCRTQNVEFFFKQWGTWSQDGQRRSKKSNGRLLDGRTWDGMPDFAAAMT